MPQAAEVWYSLQEVLDTQQFIDFLCASSAFAFGVVEMP